MGTYSDNSLLDDFDAPQPAAGGQRLRATRDMISTGYKIRQFLGRGGTELILSLFTLGAFWLLLVPPFNRPAIGPGEALPALLWKLSAAPVIPALYSLLFALGTLAFVFAAVRLIATPEAGIASVLLLTVIPGFLTSGFISYAAAMAHFFAAAAFFILLKNSTRKQPLLSLLGGFLCLAAMSAHPPLFPVLAAIPLAALTRNPNVRGIPFFFLGMLVAFLLIEVLLQKLLGAAGLSGVDVLVRHIRTQAGSPGELFVPLFTSPELAPFALIAVFALGYTARAGLAVFPIQPALFFLFTYLLVDLFPVDFSPYRTFPTHAGVMSLPLAVLGGLFLGNLLEKNALRWLGAAILLPALAALLIRL